MKQDINKFNFSRVFKLLKLDILYNKNIITTLMTISIVLTILLHYLMIQCESSASFAASFVSIFFFIAPILNILFCIMVFRRANKSNPMHISLIPATSREKYFAVVLECIILSILGCIIFFACLTASFIFINGVSVYYLFSQIESFFHEAGNIADDCISYTSDGSKLLYFANALGFGYLAISPIIIYFGIISSACITFNKGWKVLLFIILVFFSLNILQIIFFFVFVGNIVPGFNEINIIYYVALAIATLLNIGFIVMGYKNLENKQNK